MKSRYIAMVVGGSVAMSTGLAALASQVPALSQQDRTSIWKSAKELFRPLPKAAPNPANPANPAKIELGKALYFDTRLSKGNTVSCNSCHNIASYGVDNLPTSQGHKGAFGGRNSPTVMNAGLLEPQFWDGRAKDVEAQAQGPIMNPVEMGMPHKDLALARIGSIDEYRALFRQAFPKEANPLTYENIANAIGAFERTLITPSRFDAYLKGNVKALNDQEARGLRTFVSTGCVTCHSGATLGGNQFFKFGLVNGPYSKYTGKPNSDAGRYDLTKKEEDRDVFRTPTLRNVERTYPYFHDGSVTDLGDAIRIMAKTQLGKDLNGQDVADIRAFLSTLTGQIPKEALVLPVLPKSGKATPLPDNS
ncbi:cytochrome-c peroxidase [Paludibacterium paludis]|uniref:Cytochrome-c peroxidase n=1 Tax=Paludibacterium paludis TaxID=1225769 RepID=A0A918P4K3_9NEIS|nr:cytochrome c peroxidase [Paludibacterium paludis]GGY19366.1 cytochrome-c peroxidase [Paludibacterium paludis]